MEFEGCAHQDQYQSMIKKFWGRLSEMITGPDHEYFYLKKLINRFSVWKEQDQRITINIRKRYKTSDQSIGPNMRDAGRKRNLGLIGNKKNIANLNSYGKGLGSGR